MTIKKCPKINAASSFLDRSLVNTYLDPHFTYLYLNRLFYIFRCRPVLQEPIHSSVFIARRLEMVFRRRPFAHFTSASRSRFSKRVAVSAVCRSQDHNA